MKAEEIVHLATAKKKPKVEIGLRYTGKREVVYDTLSGEYHEQRPVLDGFELLLQTALVRPLRVKARKPEDIRQKG